MFGILPDSYSRDSAASLGRRVSLVPNISSFQHGPTSSNTYAFVWNGARDGRINGETFEGQIELCRNGDVSVTTNGVTEVFPRELPFAHDGFGQDGEWVAANFTNATDIAAAGGYAAWVDEQVGEGLTNGLYKLIVSVAEDPPETTLISAGDYSIAVTNAGDYVFLLEKGPTYDFAVLPPSSNITISAVDDMAMLRQGMPLRSIVGGLNGGDGTWVPGGGGFDTDYIPGFSYSRLWWLPWLRGTPDVAHIGPNDDVTFTATFVDYRRSDDVAFHWTASDGLLLATPSAQSTAVAVDAMPSWASSSILVTAAFDGHQLTSYIDLSYGTNNTPQVYCSVDVPSVLLVRSLWMDGSESATASVKFQSDAVTNGVLHIWLERGAEFVETSPSLPLSVAIADTDLYESSFIIDGISQSLASGDVQLRCAFEETSGITNRGAVASLTIVSPRQVVVPAAPDTGLCLLKGSSILASLEIEPSVAVETRWQTARRKTKGYYDPWIDRSVGFPTAEVSMLDSGVFALRVVTIAGGGCQSNVLEYVHGATEAAHPELEEVAEGPNFAGSRNHIGVAGSQVLLNIRQEALRHLNTKEYGYDTYLSARNGFSSVRRAWKCNRFVADVASEAGWQVPVVHLVTRRFLPDGRYPPAANEWANGDVAIPGWSHLGKDVYPEPGFIAGHPSNGMGHCGIVDYDGWTISARAGGVTRKAMLMLDGTCGYNKPAEEESNE